MHQQTKHAKLSVKVSVGGQTMTLFNQEGEVVREYRVATAKNGMGQQMGSECTPLGEHRIRAKIGTDEPADTVFIGRRPTGEIYTPELGEAYPNRDWILTRILWLCGCEPQHNRFGKVDTMRRYIYIHGAPDSHEMGVPSSRGCIKMRNHDIIEFFDLVEVGTTVTIERE
jgi:lipoprotein-anchoring transpeptidase ErfK/SrfK